MKGIALKGSVELNEAQSPELNFSYLNLAKDEFRIGTCNELKFCAISRKWRVATPDL
jgi:hypothetical protein